MTPRLVVFGRLSVSFPWLRGLGSSRAWDTVFCFFGVVTFMLVQLKSALSNGDNDE